MAAVATNDSAPSRVRKLPVRIRRRQRSSITVHVALTLVIGIIVPFAAYIALGQAGVDIASAMSALVVTSLLATAVLIWMAGFASLRRPDARPGRLPGIRRQPL
jgi:cytosine/uracil/thiamine/allantoin permease